MDRKIDAGAVLVCLAATLLVVSLFLDWFGQGGTAIDAWQAFEVLDLVLLGAAGAAVAAALGRLDGRVLLAAAVVAAVVVASQLVQPPPLAVDADREVGGWLALVAAAGLLAGAALTAAQIAVTVDVRGRERRRRVPAVDRRPGAEATGGDAQPAAAPGGSVAAAEAPDAPEADDATDRFAPPAADPDATASFPAAAPDDEPR